MTFKAKANGSYHFEKLFQLDTDEMDLASQRKFLGCWLGKPERAFLKRQDPAVVGIQNF